MVASTDVYTNLWAVLLNMFVTGKAIVESIQALLIWKTIVSFLKFYFKKCSWAGGISLAQVSANTSSFSSVKCSLLNIACQVRHWSQAPQLVSPSHNWVCLKKKPCHSHMWNTAPEGNVRHTPEPKQETFRTSKRRKWESCGGRQLSDRRRANYRA